MRDEILAGSTDKSVAEDGGTVYVLLGPRASLRR